MVEPLEIQEKLTFNRPPSAWHKRLGKGLEMEEENRKYIEKLEREISELEKAAVEKVRDRLSYNLPLPSTIAWIEMAMKKREGNIRPLRILLAKARRIAAK